MRKNRRFNNCNNGPQNRLIIGAFIVIVGVLSLIQNLGLFDTGQILTFWPVIFICLGILKITQSRHGSGFFVGSVFLTVGSLLTLQNMGLIVFHWREWWPVFLIGAGVAYIFKVINQNAVIDNNSPNYANDVLGNSNAATSTSDFVDITALMSSTKSSHSSVRFQGGELTAIMGSIELDLRTASFENEVVINATTVFGSIEILIPNDWFVVINGVPIMGGMQDESVPPLNSTKRLVVTGAAIMGSVEIKN